MREIKFKFVFQHSQSKETIIGSPLTLEDLIEDNDIYSLLIDSCTCDCESTGETNVVKCNCENYYSEFEIIDRLQYTGLKDKDGTEIYEGDILQETMPRSYKFKVIGAAGGFVINTFQDEIDNPIFTEALADQQTSSYIKECSVVIGNIYESKGE